MRMVALFLLIGITACSEAAEPREAIEATRAEDASACRQLLFDGSRFTVCDPGGGRVELVAAEKNRMPIRDFTALELSLGKRASRVAFAMNAGMFDEEGRPIGLAIVEGKQVHAINRRKGGGNFHLMPNGVFQVRKDGRAAVVPTTEWEASDEIRLATQSGPMLVIGSKLHPSFDEDGQSRYLRNAVGVTAEGKPLFVISEEEVSFGKLARLFRDRLKTPNALFFDGSVSALWDPANHRRDISVPLGPMVVAFKPAEPTHSR